MSSHPEGQEEKNKQITLRSRYMHVLSVERSTFSFCMRTSISGRQQKKEKTMRTISSIV